METLFWILITLLGLALLVGLAYYTLRSIAEIGLFLIAAGLHLLSHFVKSVFSNVSIDRKKNVTVRRDSSSQRKDGSKRR